MPPGMAWTHASVVVCLAAAGAVGCAPRPEGIDLLRSARSRLVEARPGEGDALVSPAERAKPQRIRNAVRDAIDASPPSQQRLTFEVPPRGPAAGGRRHPGPAPRGRRRRVPGPRARPRPAADARLAARRPGEPRRAPAVGLAGGGPRGFRGTPRRAAARDARLRQDEGRPERAFWGTPTITVADAGAAARW